MSILLTGGTGFIGSALLSTNNVFHCAQRKYDSQAFHSIFEIKNISADTNWDGAFDGVSSVIHIAGLAHSNSYANVDYQSVNVSGTLKLASDAAMSGVHRFIFVSSIGVNGTLTNKAPFCFTSIPHPHNAYAQSKYDAEVGLKRIAQETGLEVVIVRPTLVYGANAPGNFGLLTKLVHKLPFLPFGIVNNKRDFIAVQNLADLLITCAKHPDASGHTFLASDGETVSIKEFTNAIARGLGKKLIQLPVPTFLMRLVAKFLGKSEVAKQLLGDLQVDSSNIQEVLGWVPPYTMEQAMASLSEKKVECK